MIDRTHDLSITNQAVALGINRGTVYDEPRPVATTDLARCAGSTKSTSSRHHPAHPVYPYLLRHRVITQPNEVWAMDITYIPMACGFVYLAVVLDWATRKALRWRVSNTLDSTFGVAAVEEAVARCGRHRGLPHPLQHPASALEPRRPHAGRRLLCSRPPAAAAEGCLTRPPIHLSPTRNLFRKAEPLL